MGSIDTDPATCAQANRTVRADLWYGREQDGLSPGHPWRGNVWLNPPYGKGSRAAKAFAKRLIVEMGTGRTDQAITCLNVNSTSALWFDPIWKSASAHCVYRGRINFVPPGGGESYGASKGTILSYFGPSPSAFVDQFGPLGTILYVGKGPP